MMNVESMATTDDGTNRPVTKVVVGSGRKYISFCVLVGREKRKEDVHGVGS